MSILAGIGALLGVVTTCITKLCIVDIPTSIAVAGSIVIAQMQK